MGRRDEYDDAAYGLTPREWLETDPVPLTPDIDLSDPEQWRAWIRANNEENRLRFLELQARRTGGPSPRGEDGDAPRTESQAPKAYASATSVVGVRLLNAERRSLLRAARRHGVSMSDLVRRWVRAGLDLEVDPDEPDEQRGARAAAADAMVGRITDEVRRLREIVVTDG